jgi:hypothetical protein
MTCKNKQIALMEEVKDSCSLPTKNIASESCCFIPKVNGHKTINLSISKECYDKFLKYTNKNETTEQVMQKLLEDFEW